MPRQTQASLSGPVPFHVVLMFGSAKYDTGKRIPATLPPTADNGFGWREHPVTPSHPNAGAPNGDAGSRYAG